MVLSVSSFGGGQRVPDEKGSTNCPSDFGAGMLNCNWSREFAGTVVGENAFVANIRILMFFF